MEFQLNKKLSHLCAQGLAEGAFCGIAAGISIGHKGDRYRSFHVGGKTRLDNFGKPVELPTLFDLASLTKPLSTVLCTLHLIDQGMIEWQDTLNVFFKGASSAIRIYHLLQHSSGFPAYKPYYQQFAASQFPEVKQKLLEKILDENLEYATGSTSVYSDLGYILMGMILEGAAGMQLDRLFEEKIAKPVGLEGQLLFRPVGREINDDRFAVAATENCPWRHSIVQGEVHDEHCWLMGGVAGHAGLFGTIEGVLLLCELMLDVWKGYATHPAFASELLSYALSQKHPRSGWCLGFDTPTPRVSSSGRYFSSASVGHLGFSGTSFWIDPEKEVIIVLLTNRIHPSRANVQIRTFRPNFHDQLMEIICGEIMV